MSLQLQDTLSMFAFLAIELSALFLGISMLVGILQRHVPPSKVEALLSSNQYRGYFLAAGLGAITPFCSCSTIPMLKGLIRARAGFGPMMVFLFASPLLNPIIIALLIATFGFTLSAIYMLAALVVSLGAGWLLESLGFARYVRRSVTEEPAGCGTSTGNCNGTPIASNRSASSCGSNQLEVACASVGTMAAMPGGRNSGQAIEPTPRKGKYSGVWQDAWADFVNVLPYLLLGVAIGSLIYGFMPTGLLGEPAEFGKNRTLSHSRSPPRQDSCRVS